jgi:hypothetical protein
MGRQRSSQHARQSRCVRWVVGVWLCTCISLSWPGITLLASAHTLKLKQHAHAHRHQIAAAAAKSIQPTKESLAQEAAGVPRSYARAEALPPGLREQLLERFRWG